MDVMGVASLRGELSTVLDSVERGKTVAVERRGKTIALLTPAEPAHPLVDLVRVRRACEKYGLRSLHLFGSIWTDDFGPESDVDVMYTEGEKPLKFKDECRLEEELEDIFGRSIDLVSRYGVDAANSFMKKSILDGARLVYANEL